MSQGARGPSRGQAVGADRRAADGGGPRIGAGLRLQRAGLAQGGAARYNEGGSRRERMPGRPRRPGRGCVRPSAPWQSRPRRRRSGVRGPAAGRRSCGGGCAHARRRRTPHAARHDQRSVRRAPPPSRRPQAGRQARTHARTQARGDAARVRAERSRCCWRCVHVHVHVCLPPQSRSTRQAPRPIGGAGTDTGRRDQHDGRHQLSSPQHAEDPEQHGGRPQLYSFTWAPCTANEI